MHRVYDGERPGFPRFLSARSRSRMHFSGALAAASFVASPTIRALMRKGIPVCVRAATNRLLVELAIHLDPPRESARHLPGYPLQTLRVSKSRPFDHPNISPFPPLSYQSPLGHL